MKKFGEVFYKIIDIITDIIIVPIIILSGVCTFSLFSARNNNEVPTLFGMSAARVLSGSMVSEGFNIGDVVVLESVPIKDLKVGDKIGFYDAVSPIWTLIQTIEIEEQRLGNANYLTNLSSGKIWNSAEKNVPDGEYLTYLNHYKNYVRTPETTNEQHNSYTYIKEKLMADHEFITYEGTEEQKAIVTDAKTGDDSKTLQNASLSAGARGRKFHIIQKIFQDTVTGELYFITDGPDSNNPHNPNSLPHDSYIIPASYIIGRYSESKAWFGKVIGFCGSLQGIIWLVEVPCGIMLLLLTVQLIQQVDEYMQDKNRRKRALENTMLKNKKRAVEGRRIITKKITNRFKIWFNKFLYFNAGDQKNLKIREVRNAKLSLKKSMEPNFKDTNKGNQ